jgi:hypothetical protein
MNNQHRLGLEFIRKQIEDSHIFPKSLSGACNVSSIIVQAFFNKMEITSEIINNSKHCFNIIQDNTVVDLTATQISITKFHPVNILSYYYTNKIAKTTIRGKTFYNVKDRKFFMKGNIDKILELRSDVPNDEAALRRILLMLRKTIGYHYYNPSTIIHEEVKETLELLNNFIDIVIKEIQGVDYEN